MSDVRYLIADRNYVSMRHAGGEVIMKGQVRELVTELADIFLYIHSTALWAKHHFGSKNYICADRWQTKREWRGLGYRSKIFIWSAQNYRAPLILLGRYEKY